MDFPTYARHIRRDGERLASVARDLSAPVPSCPGWLVRDVVGHVAEVYEHKIACTRLLAEPDPWPPARPADDDLLAWFVDAHHRLLAMFEELGPDAPSFTWWPPDQTVGFWGRRMAHETVVHRVDAELAAGDPTPIDADLAADGVDEVLAIFLSGDWSEAPDAGAGQRVAVAAGGRRWVVTLRSEAVEVVEGVEGDEPSDALVQGTPENVLLWLWGRAGDDAVRMEGSIDAFALLRGRLRLATQ